MDTAALLRHAESVAEHDEASESAQWWDAVEGLHRRASEEVLRACERWCASPSPALRSLGLDVAAQLGASAENEGISPFAATTRPLAIAGLRDAEARVIKSAIYAWYHLRDPAGADPDEERTIASFSSRSEPELRQAVAAALGPSESDLAVQTWIHLMQDGDTDVRDWATFGLGSSCPADTPEIREALFRAASDPDATVRGEALVGLALRRDLRARDLALAELERSGPAFAESCFAEEVVSELNDAALAEEMERHKRAA